MAANQAAIFSEGVLSLEQMHEIDSHANRLQVPAAGSGTPLSAASILSNITYIPLLLPLTRFTKLFPSFLLAFPGGSVITQPRQILDSTSSASHRLPLLPNCFARDHTRKDCLITAVYHVEPAGSSFWMYST